MIIQLSLAVCLSLVVDRDEQYRKEASRIVDSLGHVKSYLKVREHRLFVSEASCKRLTKIFRGTRAKGSRYTELVSQELKKRGDDHGQINCIIFYLYISSLGRQSDLTKLEASAFLWSMKFAMGEDPPQRNWPWQFEKGTINLSLKLNQLTVTNYFGSTSNIWSQAKTEGLEAFLIR